MSPVPIRDADPESQELRFRAVAAKLQSVGRTPGEALDSLLAQENGNVESSAILVHRFAPDAFFTQAQYERLKDLLGRKSCLTQSEGAELGELIEAELDATVARSGALLQRAKP